MSAKKTIQFILTGGTIDSIDKDIHYPLVPQTKSSIPTFIKSLKLNAKMEFTQAFSKDSRDVSQKDIKYLFILLCRVL